MPVGMSLGCLAKTIFVLAARRIPPLPDQSRAVAAASTMSFLHRKLAKLLILQPDDPHLPVDPLYKLSLTLHHYLSP
jgi:hypothetical protein